MRPQREALTKHAAPMNASDVDHKTVFNPGGAPEPIAKATHGAPQRSHALGPLHRKSRSEPHELELSLLIFESA